MIRGISGVPNTATAVGPNGASGVLPLVIAKSAVAVSGAANTNENTLATISIPAGSMGPNGVLRVYTSWACTNSANNKTFRIKLGSTSYGAQVSTTITGLTMSSVIQNRNDAASQIASSGVMSASSGLLSQLNTTGTENTASALNLTLTGQKASAGETLTLNNYMVELIYGA